MSIPETTLLEVAAAIKDREAELVRLQAENARLKREASAYLAHWEAAMDKLAAAKAAPTLA